MHAIFNSFDTLITIEDGTIAGGFGSAISEFATKNNYKNRITILGVPDKFIHQGTVEELHTIAKIDTASISTEIKKAALK